MWKPCTAAGANTRQKAQRIKKAQRTHTGKGTGREAERERQRERERVREAPHTRDTLRFDVIQIGRVAPAGLNKPKQVQVCPSMLWRPGVGFGCQHCSSSNSDHQSF